MLLNFKGGIAMYTRPTPTIYKTSFNGLEVSVKGVNSAYNLSQEELESLRRTFGIQNVNGSNGNYTVFKDAYRRVLLKLFVHDVWVPITFDIRPELLQLYKSNRLYESDIHDLSKKLKKLRIQIRVKCLPTKGWVMLDTDYNVLKKTLEALIAEQKENTG